MSNSLISLKLGDLRRTLKEVELPTKEATKIVKQVVIRELKASRDRFKRMASAQETEAEAVAWRSRDMARSAAFEVNETPYTISGIVGYMPDDPKVSTRAAVHTNPDGETIIRPINAEKLAFPVRGVSPSDIITARGVQKKTARQASEIYYLIFTDNAILGRKLHSTVRDIVFLFARKDEVRIPTRIHLEKELERVSQNIYDQLVEKLSGAFQ